VKPEDIVNIINDVEKLKSFKTEKSVHDDIWIKILFGAMFSGKKEIKEEIKKFDKILKKIYYFA